MKICNQRVDNLEIEPGLDEQARLPRAGSNGDIPGECGTFQGADNRGANRNDTTATAPGFIDPRRCCRIDVITFVVHFMGIQLTTHRLKSAGADV